MGMLTAGSSPSRRGGAGRIARLCIAAVVGALAVTVGCAPDPAPPEPRDPTEPITLGDGGVYGDGSAWGASTSADGRWTAFSSAATNLVPGDDNGANDVFLRNNTTGRVTRIVEQASEPPTISRNGRYVGVKFHDGSTARYGVHDRVTGSLSTWTEITSTSAPVVTDDGSTAVHGSADPFGIFSTSCRIRDLATGTAQDCPHAAPVFGSVGLVGHSGNGRFVLYHWRDQGGTDTSGTFLLDVATGANQRLEGMFVGFGISHAVSDDGTAIATVGFGPALPPSIHDVASGERDEIPVDGDHTTVPVGFSPDGRWVGLITTAALDPADTNAAADMYRLDRTSGSLERVSVAFATGAELELGANLCGRGVGQVLTDGRVCVLDLDELSAADQNEVVDAYLVPAPAS